MSSQRPQIHVKLTIGNLEFDIECSQDQLEEAIKKILSSVSQYEKSRIEVSERISPSIRAETCKGLIRKLWLEGCFATPKALADVHSEMARRGFHYDRTAVAHALIDLVKEGVLTRNGRPRRYRYAQKRPPN